MSSIYEGSHPLYTKACTKCKTSCLDKLTEPGTDNTLCQNCFDEEHGKIAQRNKKLENLFEYARVSNKKWWQFWIR